MPEIPKFENIRQLMDFVKRRENFTALSLLTPPHAVRINSETTRYQLDPQLRDQQVGTALRFIVSFEGVTAITPEENPEFLTYNVQNSPALLPLHSLCQLLSNLRDFDKNASLIARQQPKAVVIAAYGQAISSLSKQHIVNFSGETGQNAYFETLLGLGINFTSTAKAREDGEDLYTEVKMADPASQQAMEELIYFSQELMAEEVTVRR